MRSVLAVYQACTALQPLVTAAQILDVILAAVDRRRETADLLSQGGQLDLDAGEPAAVILQRGADRAQMLKDWIR
jgi:hypothetical protein